MNGKHKDWKLIDLNHSWGSFMNDSELSLEFSTDKICFKSFLRQLSQLLTNHSSIPVIQLPPEAEEEECVGWPYRRDISRSPSRLDFSRSPSQDRHAWKDRAATDLSESDEDILEAGTGRGLRKHASHGNIRQIVNLGDGQGFSDISCTSISL